MGIAARKAVNGRTTAAMLMFRCVLVTLLEATYQKRPRSLTGVKI